ncbi:hypothetical protein Acr_11g0008920 [Actinidia rufa]|uniref:Uncharacterized protein n=1 Tax=Actinidia rufa TaxID=165716 RepID=A0A7J0FDU3_9ERIC|nr:hypothetical protein Acr_11g0008920 [Actinidia rufa]
MDTAHYSVYKKAAPPSFKGTLNTLNLFYNSPLSSFTFCHSLGLISTPEGFRAASPQPLFLFVCAGRPLIFRGPVPRNPSNIDCWLLAQISTTTVWRRLWERQFSMHLRSRNLPRPSASSPLDNRAPPMANASQVPDLEGLHHGIHGMAEQMRVMNENNARLIQLLVAANPQPPAAPSVPDVERSCHSNNRSGGRSHASTEQTRGRRRAPSPSIRERSSSSESSQTRSRKIGDLDARLDAINTGTNAPVTVDALVRQTDPPFTKRVLGARISSKFKLPTQLGIYEGKTDPMDHLDSYKSLMSLQGCSDEVMCKAFSATLKGPARSWFRKLSPGTIDSFGELSRLFVANFMSCRNRQKNASHLFIVHQKETESLKDFVKRFNQAILEVEDPSDKVIIMAMMEGLRPGPLFDSLSKNVLETLSALQSKADKYIAAEELAEAKRRRRGKDDHKRKEPDTRRNDYREETRYKRPDRDPKRSNNRRPRTPPRRPKFILPPLNAPVAQVLSEIKHEEFVKWPGKIKTDPQKRNRNKYCEFHRDHGHNTEDCFQLKEQIADLIKRGGCSTSSRKKHARSAFRSVEEEVYNLSSPCVGDQPPITFSSDNLRGLHLSHDDALVISAVIANFNVQRILIDSGNTTQPLGWINLPITLGTEPHQTTVWQDFIVVDCPSPYNAILGRPTLGGIKAITSTYHLKMKFPTLTGIGEKAGDDAGILRGEMEQLILEDPRETENTKPLEEVVPISIHPNYPDRQVMIGTELTNELRIALIDFLKKNSDVFAWSQGDVPGIDPEVAMHKLFTQPEYSPVRQKRRKFAPERLKVIEDEVNKLIKANVVREAHYLDWLANVVVAPKKGGKWRVCVDFTDLNKACPKDSFPLPKIDLIVDATSKHELLSFMDAFSGYHQIKMYPSDVEKNFFYHGTRAILLQSHAVWVKERQSNVSETGQQDVQCTNWKDYGNTSGRLLKWSIELSEFHIEYKPRTAIKAQALADFIVESTYEDTPQLETTPLEAKIPKEPAQEKDLAHWILFVDGSSNQHGCGAGLVIRAPSGEQMEYAIRMGFKATNNEAEYEALLAGLRVATELGAQSLEVFSDSQLVVNQVQGDYLAKDARMIAYLGEVKAVSAKIKEFKIHQIPREDNRKVDDLANLASTFEFISDRCIPLEFLAIPSIGIANQVLQAEESPTWMDEIIAYLQDGTLPKEKLQARRLQYRSARLCIFNGKLYKRSFSGPLLKCLRPEEAEYILKEIHEGICGNHSGARSLAKKTIRQGYFWPTMERDAAAYVKRCDKCQRFAPVSHLPHTEMVPMSSPWPFAQWGIDILGPLPRAPLQRKFGIPKVIISDNARQFDNDRFRLFCSDLAISHHFSSPGHPQANGQVEVTNRTILRNLKARLERSKSEWAEDLPSILLGLIILLVGLLQGELRLNLDLLDEKRESAELRQAAYKNRIAKYYNERVKHRSFLPGDLVLRRVTLSTRDPSAGKLGPTWEGPYKVIKVSRPGTYWLEDLNGKALLHPWNAEHLKKYYQ